MAYVALYRSYRPSKFNEVIGQKHVIKTLMNAVMENKTSHAYIFSGLRGIGKTTIARILAKAVNCEEQMDGEPCNCCSNCKLIIDDLTPDIVELDAASNNGVDEMRSLLEKVNFPPSMLKKKVYIIDEAHMLSTAAFNALLKTLEEPPKDVMFILATTEPHKIPATILSRCQRFDFKQLTLAELKEEVDYVCQKENIDIDIDALSAIAESAEGGMRDALSILDQASIFANGKITVFDVDSVTGRISSYKLIELVSAFKEKDATRSIEIINELVNMGKEVSRLVGSVIQFCRDILLFTNVGDTNEKYIYTLPEFKELATKLSSNELFYYIDVLVDIQNKIRFTTSQKIYLEVGIMKIINSAEEDIDVLGKISKLQEKFSNNSVAPATYQNSDIDIKINSLDSRIKKINSELEKANIKEFKEKIEAKLDLLEDVSSKNAALPTDLSYKLDEIEDKIRIINNTTLAENKPAEMDEVILKVLSLEEKIQEIQSPLREDEKNGMDNSSTQTLLEDIENLTKKLSLLEEKVTNLPASEESVPTEENVGLANRISEIEAVLQEISVQMLPFNDNVDVEMEIRELKNNYNSLVNSLQEGNSSAVNVQSNNPQLETLVNELLANVNRISVKLQENADSVQNVQADVQSLQEHKGEVENKINQILNSVDEIKTANKNDIYDSKFTEVNEKINKLEKHGNDIDEEVNKLKQLASFDKRKTEAVQPKEAEPATIAAKQTESKADNTYVAPKEEPKIIVTNDTKTLQTIKNVYDVKIIERILHEARGLDCREDKIRLVNSWSKLEDKVGYVLAPIAKLLKDGKMVANGKEEILIVYPTATICNHLMEPKNHIDAKQVLRITFGKDYDFLALPENTWQEKRSEYVGQFGVGIKYPRLTPITNPELNVVMVNYDQIESTQKKPLQQARAFFGSAIVEEERK